MFVGRFDSTARNVVSKSSSSNIISHLESMATDTTQLGLHTRPTTHNRTWKASGNFQTEHISFLL